MAPRQVQRPEDGIRLAIAAWGASAGARPDESGSACPRPEGPRVADAERSAVPALAAPERDVSASRWQAFSPYLAGLCKPAAARSEEQSCGVAMRWGVDWPLEPQQSGAAKLRLEQPVAAFETVPQGLPEPAPARPALAGVLAQREPAGEFLPPGVAQPVAQKP